MLSSESYHFVLYHCKNGRSTLSVLGVVVEKYNLSLPSPWGGEFDAKIASSVGGGKGKNSVKYILR